MQQIRDFKMFTVLKLNFARFSTISLSIAILSFLLMGSSYSVSESSLWEASDFKDTFLCCYVLIASFSEEKPDTDFLWYFIFCFFFPFLSFLNFSSSGNLALKWYSLPMREDM